MILKNKITFLFQREFAFADKSRKASCTAANPGQVERDEPTPDHQYAVALQQAVLPVQALRRPAGYTIILDNLDCYIKVRNMTVDHHNQLLHYINVSTKHS